jgi:hypothetical protein
LAGGKRRLIPDAAAEHDRAEDQHSRDERKSNDLRR